MLLGVIHLCLSCNFVVKSAIQHYASHCCCASELLSGCLMSALFFTCKANWVRVFLLGDVVLLNKALCLTDLWSALSRCCQSFMALILECWGEISTSCSEHCYLHQGLICCSLAKPAYISTRKLSSQDLGFTSVRLDLRTFTSKIPAKCLAHLAFFFAWQITTHTCYFSWTWVIDSRWILFPSLTQI